VTVPQMLVLKTTLLLNQRQSPAGTEAPTNIWPTAWVVGEPEEHTAGQSSTRMTFGAVRTSASQ
jgi:hypothetical protein